MEEEYEKKCAAFLLSQGEKKVLFNGNDANSPVVSGKVYQEFSGIVCGGCRSKELSHDKNVQLRCVDEGDTMFFSCRRCKYITKINT